MPTIDDRLAELNIELPAPVAPIANYVPFVRSGTLIYISGQVSIDPTGGIKGVRLGRTSIWMELWRPRGFAPSTSSAR